MTLARARREYARAFRAYPEPDSAWSALPVWYVVETAPAMARLATARGEYLAALVAAGCLAPGDPLPDDDDLAILSPRELRSGTQ